MKKTKVTKMDPHITSHSPGSVSSFSSDKTPKSPLSHEDSTTQNAAARTLTHGSESSSPLTISNTPLHGSPDPSNSTEATHTSTAADTVFRKLPRPSELLKKVGGQLTPTQRKKLGIKEPVAKHSLGPQSTAPDENKAQAKRLEQYRQASADATGIYYESPLELGDRVSQQLAKRAAEPKPST